MLRELLPDHTVACHFAEELVAKERRQALVGQAAEATTGRTAAPRGGPRGAGHGGPMPDASIFDLRKHRGSAPIS